MACLFALWPEDSGGLRQMRARRVDHQFNLIQQLQPLRLQFVVGDALAQLPLEVETQLLEARYAAVAATAVQLMDQIEDLVVVLPLNSACTRSRTSGRKSSSICSRSRARSGLLAA